MGERSVLGPLPEAESLLPAFTRGAVSQCHPVVVVVAGQPCAGKTQIADLVQAALDRRGGAVRICSDLYKSAHSRYAELLADDVRTAGVKVRPDTRRWQAALEDHVRAHRLDAVVESALADPEEFRTSATAYRRTRPRHPFGSPDSAGARSGHARPKACNTDGAPAQLHTTNVVHLRAGRGTGHRSLAVLAKNTDFYAECWGITATNVWWAYGVVESGPRNGRRGWVAGDHLATGYKHP
ncbi:Zeta toxin [Streptomyces sp. 2231.1]|nr:Zeta toxin [Streptomyces sp. 2231.1]